MSNMLEGLLGLFGVGLMFVNKPKEGASARDFVPTKSEAKAMADPLANIALRHTPEGLEDANDLVDGIAAATATGVFLIRAGTGQPGGMAEASANVTAPPPPPGPGGPTP